jgi:hypothetical protein
MKNGPKSSPGQGVRSLIMRTRVTSAPRRAYKTGESINVRRSCRLVTRALLGSSKGAGEKRAGASRCAEKSAVPIALEINGAGNSELRLNGVKSATFSLSPGPDGT